MSFSKRNDTSRKLSIENLEERIVFSNIVIPGTNLDDVIDVHFTGPYDGYVETTTSGITTLTTFSKPSSLDLSEPFLEIRGKKGDDTIRIHDNGYGNMSAFPPTNYAMALNRHVLVKGGSGDDVILGSEFSETLQGNKGDDYIEGQGHKDLIEGGMGNDILKGGAGDDWIKGSFGNDEIYGGAGHDMLYGFLGDDQLFGGDGWDQLDGGMGDDYMEGNDGRDFFFGGGGNDHLVGGEDHDYLNGGTGDDHLLGGDGDDRLWGFSGADSLFGGSGNDKLWGGYDKLADKLFGGLGADKIYYYLNDQVATGGQYNDVTTWWDFSNYPTHPF